MSLLDALLIALAGVGIHTAAMLAVTAAVAGLVYEWFGVAVLRQAWVNVDAVWVAALLATGVLLVYAGGT